MASVEIAGDVFVEPTAERLAISSAAWILAHIQQVLARQERCSVALSGGNTPGPVYRKLAEAGAAGKYDSSRLDLCLADERCVPADHVDANARLVEEQWLAIDPKPTFIIPRGSFEDWSAEAENYESVLPLPIDLVVLGIGPDGHTASLFPGASTLSETERSVIYVSDSPKPPPHRWSLSVRALREARALVTIVAGAGKADALARAIEGPWDPSQTPAQFARRGTWFVDADAAAKLTHAKLNS
jgi:6-phosphogluconolactonase